MTRIGEIVDYALSAQDAEAINRRRSDAQAHMTEHREGALGVVVHSGNSVAEGEVYPLIVTRVWDKESGYVNGQVLLDGNDTFWATSRVPGEGPGTYRKVEG